MKKYFLIVLACRTLGLAPYFPEPHLVPFAFREKFLHIDFNNLFVRKKATTQNYHDSFSP